jgi:hypothetical protein
MRGRRRGRRRTSRASEGRARGRGVRAGVPAFVWGSGRGCVRREMWGMGGDEGGRNCGTPFRAVHSLEGGHHPLPTGVRRCTRRCHEASRARIAHAFRQRPGARSPQLRAPVWDRPTRLRLPRIAARSHSRGIRILDDDAAYPVRRARGEMEADRSPVVMEVEASPPGFPSQYARLSRNRQWGWPPAVPPNRLTTFPSLPRSSRNVRSGAAGRVCRRSSRAGAV